MQTLVEQMAWFMSKVDECEPQPEIADPVEPDEAAPSTAPDNGTQVGLGLGDEEGKIADTLAELEKFYAVNESMAADVDEQLAAIVANLLGTQLSDKILNDKISKYVRPGNCASLTLTRVNSEIWDKLSVAV